MDLAWPNHCLNVAVGFLGATSITSGSYHGIWLVFYFLKALGPIAQAEKKNAYW